GRSRVILHKFKHVAIASCAEVVSESGSPTRLPRFARNDHWDLSGLLATVMRVAHRLARGVLPRYFSRFSRHAFMVPQLFACLIVKEHQRKTYRDVEALLRDVSHWCRDIGMKRIPDHNTLCRAFHALNLLQRTGRLMDRLVQWFTIAQQLGTVVA